MVFPSEASCNFAPSFICWWAMVRRFSFDTAYWRMAESERQESPPMLLATEWSSALPSNAASQANARPDGRPSPPARWEAGEPCGSNMLATTRGSRGRKPARAMSFSPRRSELKPGASSGESPTSRRGFTAGVAGGAPREE